MEVKVRASSPGVRRCGSHQNGGAMTKPIDATRAMSITRLAQVGVGVLACGAAAMAYVGLPQARPPVETDYEVTGEKPVESGGLPAQAILDLKGSSSRLTQVGNAPKATPPPPPDIIDTSKGEAKPPVGPNDIKYLGLANVGVSRMALLVVHGKQRFVREGQMVDTERVAAIDPDFVTLAVDDTQRQVPLQQRGSERVTRLRPTPGGTGEVGKAPAMAAITGFTPPRAIGGGVNGLSKLPDEYQKWPPAYQRRFNRAVNELLQQGPFPDEFSLIEKAKGYIESEGLRPDDEKAMKDLEEKEPFQKGDEKGGDTQPGAKLEK